MKMIISSFWLYITFTISTPIKKKFIKIQGHVWLRMFHICQKYAFIITIMAWSLLKKTQGSQPKCPKQKVWRKIKLAYMKLIQIQSFHTGVIFPPKHMTWQMQQVMINHSLIRCYHTGNVYSDDVPNVLALIFLTRKHMISIPTPVLQFVSHLSSDYTLYKSWQASVIRQEQLSIVSIGFCFSKINKNIH